MAQYPLTYEYTTLGATLPFEFGGRVYTDPMRAETLAPLRNSISQLEGLVRGADSPRVRRVLADLPQPAYSSVKELLAALRSTYNTLSRPEQATVSDFVTAMSLSKRLVEKSDKVALALLSEANVSAGRRNAAPALGAPQPTQTPAAAPLPPAQDVAVPGRIPLGVLAAFAGVSATLGCVGLYEGYRDSRETSIGLKSLDALGRAVIYASILGFAEVKLHNAGRK